MVSLYAIKLFSPTCADAVRYLPGELEERIREFVDYYDHERYDQSLNNLAPADVFYRRGLAVLDIRARIKIQTLAGRRHMHYDNQAINLNSVS